MAPNSNTREIHTPLTAILGCKVPILLAPMSTGAGGLLAAQVTKYGGFAFIPAGDDTADALRDEIKTFTDAVKTPKGQQIPVGAAFLGWYLDAGHKDLLIAALELKVKAVFFAFSDHMDRWVNFVRGYDEAAKRHTVIFVVIHNAEQAAAAKELGADVVVAQGIEAGGHGAAYAPPLLVQISNVQKANGEDGPLIVAAGGIMTGSHIAALLTTGAHGCLLGTRFLTAKDSYYTQSQREAMLAAKSNDATERTLAFDYMVGSLGWPKGINGRALKNETTKEFNAGSPPLDEIIAEYDVAKKEGDANRIATWAGLGCPLLTKTTENPKDIMNELVEECFARLKDVCITVEK